MGVECQMKRKELIKLIDTMARERGLRAEWRQGGRHSIVRLGEREAAVPRHREINNLTARSILNHLSKES